MANIAAPGTKVVLAAKAVPAGEYALQFIGKCQASREFPGDFRAAVMNNIVSYEENVRAVLAKVVLAEADAGVVYASDAASVKNHAVDTVDIPERLNVIADYPIGLTREGTHPAEAEQFIRFLLSARGQQILAQAGFTPAVSETGSVTHTSPEPAPHE